MSFTENASPMSDGHLVYPLNPRGFFDHWLVAGPLAEPIPDLDRYSALNLEKEIARQYCHPPLEITRTPREWDPPFTVGTETLRWRYVRCGDDHLIDLSAFYAVHHHLRAWAFAVLECTQVQAASMVLTTQSPADVWIDGHHVFRQEQFDSEAPRSVVVPVALCQGLNQILVRFEQVAVRECPYFMALQMVGLPAASARVLLPTPIDAVARRQTLEEVIDAAYLDRDVYHRNDDVIVRWRDDLETAAKACVRLQKPSGRISREFWVIGEASQSRHLLKGFETADGPHQVVVMPQPKEFYEEGQRIQKKIPLEIVHNAFSGSPYGTYEERRREALADAARHNDSIFSVVAHMALGNWPRVDTGLIMETIEEVNQRRDGSNMHMVGLLGMLHRYLHHPGFPERLRQPLEQCVLGFRYWMDEPGSDALCFTTESHRLLFHTCEVLAGQLYPKRVFTNTGEIGQWHRHKGQELALSWLSEHGMGGFRDWDSNSYFEHDFVALAHLADLAKSDEIRQLATVMMDKMLFTVALNSFQGAFGSTHGRSETPFIKNARLEATSGITRLMWGMGAFNRHCMGTVSLACARDYELPPIIPDIAVDLAHEMWARECHRGVLDAQPGEGADAWEVNKVTYRTADYMLCSAQDYRSGTRGCGEHIWQATLGPDAVVFVTHPACVSEHSARQPNFWLGNAVLPRVAQWRDVLIAVHNLPADDWMGFTHAFFPLYAFDEHALRDGWAFARKGAGYLALTASAGVRMTTRGDHAHRELRSEGRQNIWLCYMGRAAQDGSFDEFQTKVLALDVAFEGLSVRCTNLRGETLAFGWEGPFLIDGRETPINGFKHYENPYCVADWPVSQMEIRFNDWLLRLNFAR